MSDKLRFSALMDDLGLLYDKPVTADLKRLYWEDLGSLPIEAIEQASRSHRRDPGRGRYFPRPADLLAKLAGGAACHLPADAAWPLALRSFDESETVVWTAEIEQARNAAREVWASGDLIGARMAFRAAYERLLAAAGGGPVWQVSAGDDVERRVAAVTQAQARGLLSESQARRYLPAPSAPEGAGEMIAGLLTGNVVAFPQSDDAKARAHLKRLRDALAGGLERKQRDAAAERQSFEERKREAAAALASMQAERGA
ncbi:hypothetical protein [Thiococcus pfennigii]|uniref:hypothetical protein n=1 Tax=Thiococcus pfennigii TaxID=1057 RepID=UPI001907EF21|nr:hypothetical protein [Thiococcus pfennigii]MBK1699761.1 hypothetical protein [Thiococcus pfennigii]